MGIHDDHKTSCSATETVGIRLIVYIDYILIRQRTLKLHRLIHHALWFNLGFIISHQWYKCILEPTQTEFLKFTVKLELRLPPEKIKKIRAKAQRSPH